MSSDPTYLINYASNAIQIVILVVGIYRALAMRRRFVDGTYRSRALWSAALMTVITTTNLLSFVTFPNDAVGTLLGFSPFLGIVLVSFAYVDRSIVVAGRSDFFHRDTLGWSRFRPLGYGVLVVSSAAILAAVLGSPQTATSGPSGASPVWANLAFYQFFVVVPAVLGVASVAVIVASRRTPDMTLKRSIRLLGYALGFFVASLVLGAVFTADTSSIVSDILTVLATYVLYLSTMSMTSLGKVEKTA